MNVYTNPVPGLWPEICKRPQLDLAFLDSTVRNVLTRVKKSGDVALYEFTRQFDKVTLERLAVSADEIDEAHEIVSPELRNAMQIAAANIEKFHAAQIQTEKKIETFPGVTCWRKPLPIEKVGLYVPGGSAPLFSTVLMLGVPAKIAGCKEVVMCTPPGPDGKVHPAILVAARQSGIDLIYKIGGAQAIAAMAYGTETIQQVYKIFGPGNQYVTKAKQLIMEEGIAIDMPAGPSEVLVLADKTADPVFVAADLLSQAEHGEDSQVVLVLIGSELLPGVQRELDRQLEVLPRKALAQKSLSASNVVIFEREEEAIEFVNTYAAEHLIINTAQAEDIADRITNAGSVFIGNYSPEAAGDYATGPNHTLPTNGYAKAQAGVSLESFLRYITFQQVSEEGIRGLGPTVEILAEAENLAGHREAIRKRLDKLKR